MPEIDPVRAKFVADISDLISQLQAGKKAFEDLGGGADGGKKKVNDFSAAMDEAKEKMMAFLVEALAVKAMYDATTESLAALGEKQDAINGLNLALAAQAHYTQETSGELRKYAEELSRSTTYSENAVMGSEKYFAVLGMSKGQIEQAVQATSDLAAMTGMDLSSAQMQVGKAIETGSSKALKQYGIEIDKAGDATQRFHQVLDGIESKMGGAAAAAASTYTGHIKQLRNATEEAKASFGFFLTQLATPPSGEMIGFMRGLSDFFAKDLVMGIAYVRAGISLIPASILDMVASVESTIAAHPNFIKIFELGTGQALGSMPDAGKMAQQAKDLANSLRIGADQIIADAQKAAATGIQGTVTPTNNANPSGFRAADENKRAEEATKAIQAELVRMGAEGDKAYATMSRSAAYFAAIQEGLGKTGADFAAKQDEVDSKTDQSLTVLKEGYDRAMEAAQKGGVSTAALTARYKEQQQAIIDAGNAQKALNDGERDASLGTITQSEAVKTLTEDHHSLTESLHKVAVEEKRCYEQAVAMRQGIVDIAGAASGLASALGMGGVSTALGAVQKGMSDFSKMADAQNPLQLAVATIGFATDIAKGIKSLFGGKTEAQRIGQDLGDGVTDGLIKAIEATEKKDHIGRAMAEALHSSDALKEIGLTNETQKLINDEMNAVKLGAINAKEGVADLGKAFMQLETAAKGGSTASEAAMIQMIQRSRELGETIPEIDAYVKGLMTDAATQFQIMLDSQAVDKNGPGSGGDKQAAANDQLFNAVFSGALDSMGLVTAWKTIGPALASMQKLHPDSPLTGASNDAAMLAPLMNDKNSAFYKAASGSEAGGKFTKDLLDSGNLSQASLKSIETTGKTFYDQALKDAAKSLSAEDAQKVALQQELPLLTQMQNAQAMGLKLSPDMQAMLTAASKDGLLPALGVANQSLIVQQQTRDAVYKLAGLQVPPAGGVPGGGPNAPGPGGFTPDGKPIPLIPDHPTGRDGIHAAEGYYSPSMGIGPLKDGGTPMVVHPGERVSVTPASRNSGGGGDAMNTDEMRRNHLEIKGALAALPSQFAASIRDVMMRMPGRL